MKLIYKIFFIFIMFLCTFAASGAYSEAAPFEYTKNEIISSYDCVESDVIKGEETLVNISFVENLSNSNRYNTCSGNKIGGFYEAQKAQFQKLISYVYSKSYLDNKERLLLKISYYINPNAP